jgi:hypothetical protein
MVFTNMASGVMLRALATELFPTAFRGAAGGTLALLETLGAVAWLFLYSRAMDRIGNQQLVIPPLVARDDRRRRGRLLRPGDRAS